MRVIGFNFKKISVDKLKDPEPGMKIKTNIEIRDITKQELDLLKGSNILSFEYEFNLNYQPRVADILFTGNLIMLFEDQKQVKDIEKNWKKQEISDDIKIPVLNIIFAKCNLKALQLEEDLALPQHIPSPTLSKSD